MAETHRYARLELEDGRRAFVEVVGEEALVLSNAPWAASGAGSGLSHPTGERVSFDTARARGEHRTDNITLLAPVSPSKILCVGRNYRAHAKELGNDVPVEPMIFYKPPSSLLDPEGAIVLPPADISSRIDHEAELGVVIGRRIRNASLAEARDAVFGLTLVCDVTARDLQKKDGQWWRAKGMDTFCPVGPSIVSGLDPQALRIRCRVNGSERQSGSTSDMIFSVDEVIRHISQVVTLEPGDLIATGTPEGVGPLTDGDSLEIEVGAIGILRSRVIGSDPSARRPSL